MLDLKTISTIHLLKYIFGDKMKKVCTIIISIILLATIISCSAKEDNNIQITADEWTGTIRIEGKNETIWMGTVTVGEITFDAKNVSSGLTESFTISYPSALGALIEASEIDGFSYFIDYYPSWNAFILTNVEEDSDWWHYWVDYEMPMVGAGDFELTNDHSEILFGYLESWTPKPLKIEVDRSMVKEGESFVVNVLNQTDGGVEDATVYVGSETHTTDIDGSVAIDIDSSGNYDIYAEKDGFVRSDKENIQVKSLFEIILERLIDFFEWIMWVIS